MSLLDPMPNSETIDYSLFDHSLTPEDRENDFLEQFAPLIVASYRRVFIDQVEPLSSAQIEHALSAVKPADRLVYALSNEQKPVGLFAYSVYTPASNERFYENLAREAATLPQEHQALLRDIDQVVVAKELVVAKRHHGNGLSPRMRAQALARLSNERHQSQGRALVGEMQSAYSAVGRLHLPGETVWGRHILQNGHGEPQDPGTILYTAKALGKAYLATNAPGARATYDDNTATYFSPEFDKPLPHPEKRFQQPIMDALADIETRQQEAKPGQVAASIAVTIPWEKK
jgi:hypothetical protein